MENKNKWSLLLFKLLLPLSLQFLMKRNKQKMFSFIENMY